MSDVPRGFEIDEAAGLRIRYRDFRMALVVGGFTVLWCAAVAYIAVQSPLPPIIVAVFGAAALVMVGVTLWYALRRRTLAVRDGQVVLSDRSIAGDDIVGFEIVKTGGWSWHGLSVSYHSVDHHVTAKLRGGEGVEVLKVASRSHADWVVERLERALRLGAGAPDRAVGASN